MKGHTLQFFDCDTTDLYEIVPKFTDTTMPYQKFVDAVYQLYLGSDAEKCWLIVDMDKLVGETSRTGISSLTNLGKYYRDFITITTYLIVKNCLATPEQNCVFAHSFPPELWRRVSY